MAYAAPVASDLTGDPVKDRLASLQAYDRIYKTFAAGLDTSVSAADGTLLRDLVNNSALFVSGGLISMKESFDMVRDLQAHMRKSGTGGQTAIDIFNAWLNGSDEVSA